MPPCECAAEECRTSEEEVSEALCGSNFLIVRTAFPGCGTIRYDSITWDLVGSFILEDDMLVGCVVSIPTDSARTGRTELPESCDWRHPIECLVCPETADPMVLANFDYIPLCE